MAQPYLKALDELQKPRQAELGRKFYATLAAAVAEYNEADPQGEPLHAAKLLEIYQSSVPKDLQRAISLEQASQWLSGTPTDKCMRKPTALYPSFFDVIKETLATRLPQDMIDTLIAAYSRFYDHGIKGETGYYLEPEHYRYLINEANNNYINDPRNRKHLEKRPFRPVEYILQDAFDNLGMGFEEIAKELTNAANAERQLNEKHGRRAYHADQVREWFFHAANPDDDGDKSKRLHPPRYTLPVYITDRLLEVLKAKQNLLGHNTFGDVFIMQGAQYRENFDRHLNDAIDRGVFRHRQPVAPLRCAQMNVQPRGAINIPLADLLEQINTQLTKPEQRNGKKTQVRQTPKVNPNNNLTMLLRAMAARNDIPESEEELGFWRKGYAEMICAPSFQIFRNMLIERGIAANSPYLDRLDAFAPKAAALEMAGGGGRKAIAKCPTHMVHDGQLFSLHAHGAFLA